MRLGQALISAGREVRDVAVVVLAQRVEHIGAVLIHRRERRPAFDHLEKPKFGDPHRRESLIDEHVHRVRMIDGEQPQLIEIRRLPQLLGHLNHIPTVPWLERFPWDAYILMNWKLLPFHV